MTRLTAFLLSAWLALAPVQALAQSNFLAPGGQNVPGAVQMCLNASGQAVACAGAVGTAGYPAGAVPLTGSGTGTTTTTGTLTAVAGKTTYACGFSVNVSGATAAGFGTVVMSGLITGNMNFGIAQQVVTVDSEPPLTVPFSPCLPASGLNTNIVVTSTMGAGTTNNTVSIWGFNL